MTGYTKEDMIDAFVRGYGASEYRGRINDFQKMDAVTLRTAENICARWLEQRD